MSPVLVSFVYGLCLVLALALLYYFPVSWYWHILGLAAAFTLGLVPVPVGDAAQDLTIGSVFLFLFAWGAGFPLFRKHHGPIHIHWHAHRHA